MWSVDEENGWQLHGRSSQRLTTVKENGLKLRLMLHIFDVKLSVPVYIFSIVLLTSTYWTPV